MIKQRFYVFNIKYIFFDNVTMGYLNTTSSTGVAIYYYCRLAIENLEEIFWVSPLPSKYWGPKTDTFTFHAVVHVIGNANVSISAWLRSWALTLACP